MIVKSYNLEKNIDLIKNYQMFLFCGENHGIKREFKEKIKDKDKEKDKEVLNFFQSEIIQNESILLKEISNKSLFGKKKIIFINDVNDKIFFFLQDLAEVISDEQIFFFADILDKRSKIRNYFEKSKDCGIVACYGDNEITIKRIITEQLNDFKGFNNQIINLIIQNTGLDRNKVKNEIDKIISCFPEKIIDLDKLDSLLNQRTNQEFNLLKDEALKGNKEKTNRLLSDTVLDFDNIYFYLNSINQRINKLREIEVLKQNISNYNLESLIENLKPPIFWKDKPVLIEQAKKWNKNSIQNGLEKTYDAELKIKSNSSIRNDLILKNLIVDLCSIANVSLINQK